MVESQAFLTRLRASIARNKPILDRLEQSDYQRKQEAAKPRRYYGDGGTIHGTNHVDVETRDGEVVAIWFRCQPLPFKQSEADERRADDMKSMYDGFSSRLTGVEILDAT